MIRRKFYYLTCWSLVVVLAVLGFVFCLTLNDIVLVAFAFVSVALMWADCEHQKEKEKHNPFSVDRILQVLSFTTDKMSGTKKEFVDAFGSEMYDYCVGRGFIHELLGFVENPRWEVTKVGRRAKASLEA